MNIKRPDLDSIVLKIYGEAFTKFKNIKTAYSIFTPFKSNQTQQIAYFYIFKVSAKCHLSEGTINYALKKYNPFLSKVQFLLIEKNFDWTYYLIKSKHYLISMDQIISVQRQCQEVMEKQYILKTIQFLISIYKDKKWVVFPELTPNSLGINEEGQIKICDYEFYCRKQFQLRSLTQNICSCLNPMIKIAFLKASSRILPSQSQFERLKQNYGDSFALLIKNLVLDPMQDMEKQGVHNGQSRQINIKKIQEVLNTYYKTVDYQDNNKTLDQTQEQQEYDKNPRSSSSKYRETDILTIDTIKQPFLFRDEVKINKRRNNIKIASLVMILLLLTTGAFFFFTYYSNQISCNVGTFKSQQKNECLSCAEGCLRCQSDIKTSCFSCAGKMYLVLNDQKDTMGACQTTCAGIVLKSNLCLRSKVPSMINEVGNITKNQ